MLSKSGNYLVLAIFIVIFIAFSAGKIVKYVEDSNLNSESSTVVAKIVDESVSIRKKKGIEIQSYAFQYTFSVTGKEYGGNFETNQEYGEQYSKSKLVPVVYSLKDPSVHKIASNVETDQSISGLLWGILKALFFAGVMALILGSVIANKLGLVVKEDEADKQPEPAA